VAMTQIARAGGRSLIVSEALRFKNAALAEDLGLAQERLQASNEQLERRVAERTTELVAAHEKLALAERMVSVGTLAAGVAHEINNPMSFVLSNLEYMQDAVQLSLREITQGSVTDKTVGRLNEAVTAIDDAYTGATRVRGIVSDLNSFSRGADDGAEAVDLVETMETAIRMATNELRHRARLERELGPVPPVVGHSGKIAQVFLNLLVNAAQSIPEGSASRNEVRVVTRTGADGRAIVEVRDTGGGIAPGVLPRILDPFFTTKPVGQGTGLGLSICHGIIRGMGGELQVESALGKGSIFRVLLPSGGSPTGPVRRAPPEVRTGRARILVIDVEELFGKGVERTIGDEHEVVLEVMAQHALSRISNGETFDVILCDMMMPDCTGMEFHDKLRSIDPSLAARVVFTTGGAFTGPTREFLERVPNPHIGKPFTKRELQAALDQVLGKRR
jgi:signal transduction histidine kinase